MPHAEFSVFQALSRSCRLGPQSHWPMAQGRVTLMKSMMIGQKSLRFTVPEASSKGLGDDFERSDCSQGVLCLVRRRLMPLPA
jgi:hypothetical protein